MLLLLSPSKTLDVASPIPGNIIPTQPVLLPYSRKLIALLRRLPVGEIAALMDISEKLAHLNAERYRVFRTPFTPGNARPALFTFKGDVYEGMDAAHYSAADCAFAQAHLRILSGLYGLLRPLDLIQPYRLEMGTRLSNPHGRDLYRFWGETITQEIAQALKASGSKTVINLASQEYAKAVQAPLLRADWIDIVFKEKKGKEYKIIGLFAKRARGRMADFIIKNRITVPAALADFCDDGYRHMPGLSSGTCMVFVR